MTATTGRQRRGPRGRDERAVERLREATAAPPKPPRFPTRAHVPFSWPCCGCGFELARTTIVPPLGTAIEIRCPRCSTVDRLVSADERGVVVNSTHRVCYAPPGVDVAAGARYVRRQGVDG